MRNEKNAVYFVALIRKMRYNKDNLYYSLANTLCDLTVKRNFGNTFFLRVSAKNSMEVL